MITKILPPNLALPDIHQLLWTCPSHVVASLSNTSELPENCRVAIPN